MSQPKKTLRPNKDDDEDDEDKDDEYDDDQDDIWYNIWDVRYRTQYILQGGAHPQLQICLQPNPPNYRYIYHQS